jgi:RimJ/RimL family protein N-acetyltransferase
MDVFLETERLVLRRYTPDDADLLTELDSDPDVMFYVNGGKPTRRQWYVERMPDYLAYYSRPDGYGFYAAVERASGEFLGWFHLRPHEGAAQDEPELGYRLRKSAWGKGYATEGSIALIDRAFALSGARRVYAETMVVNAGSRRVMEKAGMRLVRVFHQEWPDRIPGDEHGDVEYEITREEWARV